MGGYIVNQRRGVGGPAKPAAPKKDKKKKK